MKEILKYLGKEIFKVKGLCGNFFTIFFLYSEREITYIVRNRFLIDHVMT